MMKLYGICSGPFKGHAFLSDAPDVESLNKKPDYRVIFLGPNFKGLETWSLMTYDADIVSLNKAKWKLVGSDFGWAEAFTIDICSKFNYKHGYMYG